MWRRPMQAGGSAGASEVVGRVEDARKNGKRIDEWIKSISDLHKVCPGSSAEQKVGCRCPSAAQTCTPYTRWDSG